MGPPTKKPESTPRPLYLPSIVAVLAVAFYVIALRSPLDSSRSIKPSIVPIPYPDAKDCKRTDHGFFCESAEPAGDGLLVLSCDKWRGRWNTCMQRFDLSAGELGKGELFSYDLDSPTPTMRPIPLSGFNLNSNPFHPLGARVHEHPLGDLFLQVNHRLYDGVVEVFSMTGVKERTPAVEFVRTVKHALINTPNAVEVVGDVQKGGKRVVQFYLTNDHYRRGQGVYLNKLFEDVVRAPWANALYCEVEVDGSAVIDGVDTDPTRGVDCRVEVRGLRFANGIVKSLDGKRVFISETTGKAVGVYARDESTNHLTLLYRISNIPFLPDNLSIEPSTGDIIVTGHPSIRMVVRFWTGWPPNAHNDVQKYLSRPRPPSQVVRLHQDVSTNAPESWTMSPVFKDDGSTYGTSCSAWVDDKRNKTVVVGLYEVGLLECKV